jgi:hypothetical protein
MDTASDNPNPTPVEPATQPKTERRKPVIMRATEWLAPRWTAIYRFAVLALLAYIAFKPIYVDGYVEVWGSVRANLDSSTTVRVSSLPDVTVRRMPEVDVNVKALPSVDVDSLPSIRVNSLPGVSVYSLPEPIRVYSR